MSAKSNLAAIANVSTVLRWVEELLNFWADEPADALRAEWIRRKRI